MKRVSSRSITKVIPAVVGLSLCGNFVMFGAPRPDASPAQALSISEPATTSPEALAGLSSPADKELAAQGLTIEAGDPADFTLSAGAALTAAHGSFGGVFGDVQPSASAATVTARGSGTVVKEGTATSAPLIRPTIEARHVWIVIYADVDPAPLQHGPCCEKEPSTTSGNTRFENDFVVLVDADTGEVLQGRSVSFLRA